MLDDDRVAGPVAEHRLTEDDALQIAEGLAHRLARRAFRVARDT